MKVPSKFSLSRQPVKKFQIIILFMILDKSIYQNKITTYFTLYDMDELLNNLYNLSKKTVISSINSILNKIE